MRVSVGAGPAEDPAVSDTTPDPSQVFLLEASVRNQGDVVSDSTTVRYFVSTDSTISDSDTELGTDTVPALGPGGGVDLSELVTAPSNPGTYWVGVCVDPVPGESNTANQCSIGIEIAVGCIAPTTLELMDDTILTTETFEACETIFVGPNFAVMGNGNVTLRAGERVVFRSEVLVEWPATLRILIELPVTPP